MEINFEKINNVTKCIPIVSNISALSLLVTKVAIKALQTMGVDLTSFERTKAWALDVLKQDSSNLAKEAFVPFYYNIKAVKALIAPQSDSSSSASIETETAKAPAELERQEEAVGANPDALALVPYRAPRDEALEPGVVIRFDPRAGRPNSESTEKPDPFLLNFLASIKAYKEKTSLPNQALKKVVHLPLPQDFASPGIDEKLLRSYQQVALREFSQQIYLFMQKLRRSPLLLTDKKL
jgi:hypothetical protein